MRREIERARRAIREHWPTLGIVTTGSALVGYILGQVL